MIQINDESFDKVFKIESMTNNRKYAGGVIFANKNEDALKIAKQLVKAIQDHIDMKKETDNDI